jgi:signal transduction histidine kinase
VQAPYAGFSYARDAKVLEIFEPGKNGSLLVGDVLVQIGSKAWASFASDPHQVLFDGVERGETIPIQVRRNGQPIDISWQFPGPTSAEVNQRINSEWWLPYTFWFAGLATLLQVRPRNRTWKLLIGFNFLTAIWLVAGSVSSWHVWYSVSIFHTAVWLSIPIYWFLHLSFPKPLLALPRWVVVVSFTLALLLIGLEWVQVLPEEAFQLAFFATVVSNFFLLCAQFLRDRRWREVGLPLGAILLSFLPIMVSSTIRRWGEPPIFEGGALLAFPAIPGAYFFTAYQTRLGPLKRRADRLVKICVVAILGVTIILLILALGVDWLTIQSSTLAWGIPIMVGVVILALFGIAPIFSLTALAGTHEQPWFDRQSDKLELRANRLFVPYLFIILLTLFASGVVLLASYWLTLPGETLLVSIFAVVVTGVAALTAYTPFRHFVERYLFGLTPLPTSLLETFTNQLVGLHTRESLIRLLRDNILGVFQVRESLLFYVGDSGQMILAYSQGVDPENLISLEMMAEIDATGLTQQDSQSIQSNSLPEWVQFVIPLQHNEQLVGIWLLGHREPDNIYSRRELATLRTLANQVAIALISFSRAEKLRALYEVNIDQREQERKRLARDLHDETLGQLGAMAMYMDEHTLPEFHNLYESTIQQLRRLIAGLRPKMLDFGLWTGLTQLVDDSMSRENRETEILFDVPKAAFRYQERIEEHVYRIVQQALENGLRHAHAEIIRIYGNLYSNRIELTVEDNGVGFDYEEDASFIRLLEQRHFGLAGMYERAQLIQAKLHLESSPGHGTCINLLWGTPDDPSPGVRS